MSAVTNGQIVENSTVLTKIQRTLTCSFRAHAISRNRKRRPGICDTSPVCPLTICDSRSLLLREKNCTNKLLPTRTFRVGLIGHPLCPDEPTFVVRSLIHDVRHTKTTTKGTTNP